ncbi:MAG: choice-of-anchor B family protein [Bacteroidia bacterium]
MKNSAFVFVLLFNSTLVFGQNFGLDSLSTWKREGLPEIDKEIFNDIWGWHDGNGREYAIMGSLDSVYFIEVTDPKKPVLRDVKAGKSRYAIHRDFKTYKNYCYAVADEGQASLQIFDLSYLPDSVSKVYDDNEHCEKVHNIFIEQNKLYLGTCRPVTGGVVPMRVLLLENPEKPTLLCDVYGPKIGGNSLFKEVHDLYVKNDTVYCSTGNDGLFTVAYQKDSTLKKNTDSSWYEYTHNYDLVQWGAIVSYPSQGYNHSSWMTQDSRYMVMADETHGAKLKMLEFTWTDVPEVLSTFGSRSNEGSIPHNVFIHKKKVYVSYYHQGVLVYDIENPSYPQNIAHWDTYPDNIEFSGMYGCWGIYPFLPSGNIIASDQIYGLFVLNLKTSVSEHALQSNIEVFPNPTDGEGFNVSVFSGEDSIQKINIFNINGKLVYSVNNCQSELYIHKNDLGGSGVYVLKAWSKGQFATKKIIFK